MEDLASQLGEFCKKKKQIEEKWDAEVESIKERLRLILFPSPSKHSNGSLGLPTNTNTTPQQIKKKPKRLSSLNSSGENVNLNKSPKCSETEIISSIVTNEPSISLAQNTPPLESSVAEPHRVGRPQRAAKLKIENSMKEPSLLNKLRRPSNPDETISKNTTLNATQKDKTITAEIVETEKRNSSNTYQKKPVNRSTKSNGDVEVQAADESIQILTNIEPVVEIISDNETEKMPPPMAPPKKKATRAKNKASNVEMERRTIKKEKNSMTADEAVDASKNNTQMLEESLVTIKKEKESEDAVSIVSPTSSVSTVSTVSTDSKRGRKPKKALKHKPIKEERLSETREQEVVEAIQPMRTRSSKEKKSLESVYEDAICNNEAITHNIDNNEHLNSAPIETQVTENIEKPSNDATFVSSKDEKDSAQNNATFVSNPVQTTFIMETIPNETIIIATNNDNPQNPNATFDINSKQPNQQENNSLITEDESFDVPQIPKFKPMKNNQKKKELFNPCVQSPVKKKVEAFEKAAAGSASPPQRQTRTKTRAKKTKENIEPENMVIREIKKSASTSSVTTPTGLTRTGHLGRFLTPTQQIAANAQLISSGAIKKMPNSASKIQAFPTKVGTSVYKSSSSSSVNTLSREQSAEDLKRGITKLQQLADERKKKREQKQQQAAQSREAKEKERTERLKKVMEEREDKRRKVLEAEQRKRELEDIDKNLKMQEEKREAAKRMEKEKLRQRAAVEEAARKEREMLEKMRIQKHKNEIKMQLQQQQKELILKKQKQLMPKYDFDMLNSDDSTDDEGKTSHKRPPVPAWSTSAHRGSFIARQNFLPSKIIDSFFSVQPMTPDLKQIFPAIDPRHLKRNSSVIWRTPPRYSGMPKY